MGLKNEAGRERGRQRDYVTYPSQCSSPENGVEPDNKKPRRALFLRGFYRVSDYMRVMADRGGFEPPIRLSRIHAFQACAFNRSATCPDLDADAAKPGHTGIVQMRISDSSRIG